MIEFIRYQLVFLGKNCLSECEFCGVALSPFMLFIEKSAINLFHFLNHKEVDVPLKSRKSSGISGVDFFSNLFVGRSFHGLCSSTPLVTLMQA